MRAIFRACMAVFVLFCAALPISAEYDPSGAGTLPLNGSASGSVSEQQRTNWWTVTVPSDGKLVVETFSSAELLLYLYEKNGTVHIKSYEPGWGVHTTLVFDNLLPGTYQVKVDLWTGTGSYTIKSAFTPTSLAIETEPNDTAAQAVELPATGSDTAHLGYYGEGYTDGTDWWKVTVPSDGKLFVEVSSALPDSNLQTLVYLYDQNKETNIRSYNSGWGRYTTLNFDNIMPGTYYIKIDRWNGFGSYTITSTFTPTTLAIETEPNDSVKVAVNLPPNGSDTAHIGFYGNGYTDATDWWKITVPSDGRLFVEVTAALPDSNLQTLVYLFDQNSETQIKSYNGGWGRYTTLNFDNIMPGTYYIKIDRWQHFGSYTIASTFTPTSYTVETEPNDTWDKAVTLAPNGSANAHLGFYGNGYTDTTDWWTITVPSDGRLVVETTAATPDSNIAIMLYLFDNGGTNQIKGYESGWGRHTTLVYDNLAAGTYQVKADRWVHFGSYQIKNTFTPNHYHSEREPNDTRETAVPAALNTGITGHLAYYGNGRFDANDYYSFTVPAGWDSLFVRVAPDSTLTPYLHILNGDGTEIAASWGPVFTFVSPAAGTYYLYLSHWTGYGGYGFIAQKDWPDSVPVTTIPPEGIEPPANVAVADVPNDQGHTLRLTWTASSSESSGAVSWYRIFRSRSSSLTDPISMNRFASLDSLLYWEERAIILIDSVAAGVTNYTDSNVPLNGRQYYYWLQSVGSGGASKLAAAAGAIVTSVEEIALEVSPQSFRVDQPFPNPFNPSTTIRFTLPAELRAKLTVYDALGRTVAVVLDRTLGPGVHETVWNGRADSGASVGSGLYLYRFEAGAFKAQGKMLLVR